VTASIPTRIVVLTDQASPGSELLEALRRRTSRGLCQIHVLMPDPARSEVHLLHPERHQAAVAALATLNESLPQLRAATGAPVTVSVSVRHDGFEAVEELALVESVDEIIVALAHHAVADRLHHDVAHRLTHLKRPVYTLEADELVASS
jgi:hypothetical protein